MSPRRRTKTTRQAATTTSSSSSEDTNETDRHKILQQQQEALTTLYRGISLLHFGQITLFLKKSGFTLACLNVIGAPFLASSILFLLSNAATHKNLQKNTFKRLNGLMGLYAMICLALVGLVPKLHNPSGLLYFISASSTFYVAAKGYKLGIQSMEPTTSFWKDTKQLIQKAALIPYRIPKDVTSIGYFVTLWCIAMKKSFLAWNIVQILVEAASFEYNVRRAIAPIVSQLAKLTALGGTIVTVASMEDEAVDSRGTFVSLNWMGTYVLGTMGVFGLSKASTIFELGEGCLFSLCAIFTAVTSFTKSQHENKKDA